MSELNEEYKLQRKIERYNLYRPLNRPKTTYVSVIMQGLLLVAITALFVIIIIKTATVWYCEALVCLCYILAFDLTARWISVTSVKCYQHYASDDRRRRCLCVPSCSEYAVAVLKRSILPIAVRKIYIRLFKTCKCPDYKIDLPYKKYSISDFEKFD